VMPKPKIGQTSLNMSAAATSQMYSPEFGRPS
jgi:hypothetical protein